jgi:RHS repeat-associated protein
MNLRNRFSYNPTPYPTTYSFQGQERDDEIKGEGNSINFKYRMHDPRVGRFFVVDPLVAKYPYNSPYSFSGNKVIRFIELEGLEPTDPFAFLSQEFNALTSNVVDFFTVEVELSRMQKFLLNHPSAANDIGAVSLKSNTSNISTDAARFALRGKNANSPSTLKKNTINGKTVDEGSQIGAFRHVLWQAIIRKKLGFDIAVEAGNAHEETQDPSYVDMEKREFGANELALVDETVDLLNNRIGREVGRLHPNASTQQMAIATLQYYYKEGFYTANQGVDKKIRITRSKITETQYNELLKRFKTLDNDGRTDAESEKVQEDIRSGGLGGH